MKNRGPKRVRGTFPELGEEGTALHQERVTGSGVTLCLGKDRIQIAFQAAEVTWIAKMIGHPGMIE